MKESRRQRGLFPSDPVLLTGIGLRSLLGPVFLAVIPHPSVVDLAEDSAVFSYIIFAVPTDATGFAFLVLGGPFRSLVRNSFCHVSWFVSNPCLSSVVACCPEVLPLAWRCLLSSFARWAHLRHRVFPSSAGSTWHWVQIPLFCSRCRFFFSCQFFLRRRTSGSIGVLLAGGHSLGFGLRTTV